MEWMVEFGSRAWTRSCPNFWTSAAAFAPYVFFWVWVVAISVVMMEVPRVLRRETIVGITE